MLNYKWRWYFLRCFCLLAASVALLPDLLKNIKKSSLQIARRIFYCVNAAYWITSFFIRIFLPVFNFM
ncbi:MAG: hypothetical protein JWP12_3133 [Bacteroidetes bacterium]|nr:hypothetical protein [Bacteroidota bacterium]